MTMNADFPTAMTMMLDGKLMSRVRRYRRDVHFRNASPGAAFLRRSEEFQ